MSNNEEIPDYIREVQGHLTEEELKTIFADAKEMTDNLTEDQKKSLLKSGKEHLDFMDMIARPKKRWRIWGNLNDETSLGIVLMVIFGLVGNVSGWIWEAYIVGSGISTLGALIGLTLIHRGNANAAITKLDRREFERFMEEILLVELGANALNCDRLRTRLERQHPLGAVYEAALGVRDYDFVYLPMRALKILPINDMGGPELTEALGRFMNYYRGMCNARNELFTKPLSAEEELGARRVLLKSIVDMLEFQKDITTIYGRMDAAHREQRFSESSRSRKKS